MFIDQVLPCLVGRGRARSSVQLEHASQISLLQSLYCLVSLDLSGTCPSSNCDCASFVSCGNQAKNHVQSLFWSTGGKRLQRCWESGWRREAGFWLPVFHRMQSVVRGSLPHFKETVCINSNKVWLCIVISLIFLLNGCTELVPFISQEVIFQTVLMQTSWDREFDFQVTSFQQQNHL